MVRRITQVLQVRRLLGHPRPAAAKHLAELLPPRSEGRLRRLPHACPMSSKVRIITPAPPGSRKGNRITALRWARILRDLGRRVVVTEEYRGERCDLLVALHALRSAPSVDRYRSSHPDAPLVLALTGTDLYGSLHTQPEAQRAVDQATRLIVLQPMGLAEVPEAVRSRARVIYQSVPSPRSRTAPRRDRFEVCVLGHLRPVKDPFRTALAARLLPAASRLSVLHVGAALSPEMGAQAHAEAAANPRYHWLGDVPRGAGSGACCAAGCWC